MLKLAIVRRYSCNADCIAVLETTSQMTRRNCCVLNRDSEKQSEFSDRWSANVNFDHNLMGTAFESSSPRQPVQGLSPRYQSESNGLYCEFPNL